MIVKSVTKQFTPGKDEATGKMEIITSTEDGPIAIRFESPQEMLDMACDVLMAARKGHDVILFNSKDEKIDHKKFVAAIADEEEKSIIKFQKPQKPKAKPMKGENQ